MKSKLNLRVKPSVVDRDNTYQHYLNKYYNLYMNAYNFTGLDYQQKDFLLRKLWCNGKIACFKMKGSDNLLVFTDFAPMMFNIYDWPVDVTLVNTRGVKFIPTTPQRVDKDVAIGYAQRNKKPVLTLVDYYIQKIVDCEMVIKINLQVQKTPWIVKVTPESRERMKEFYEDILEDKYSLFCDVEDISNLDSLTSGAPYILDKLYSYKCALENELREYLGFQNLGVGEKKEHLISTEIEANNEATESSGECFLDVMTEFFERVREVTGITITVEANIPDSCCEKEDKKEGEEDENL